MENKGANPVGNEIQTKQVFDDGTQGRNKTLVFGNFESRRGFLNTNSKQNDKTTESHARGVHLKCTTDICGFAGEMI